MIPNNNLSQSDKKRTQTASIYKDVCQLQSNGASFLFEWKNCVT